MKKRSNILIVSSSLGVGGAETVIANLCRQINRELFNVTICHLKERGAIGQHLIDEGYAVIGIKNSKIFRANYLSCLKLRKIIKKYEINLVHSHNTYSLADASLCKIMCQGIKFIHTFHYGNYPNYDKKYMFIERLTWRVTDRLVAVGYEQKKSIKKAYKIPDKSIETIWNGIEIKKCKMQDNLRNYFSDGKVVIGSISTFIEQKGLPHLMEVAAKMKERRNNIVFIVVGDGPLRSEIQAYSKSLSLDEIVIFTGRIDNAASKVLPYIDIFIQTSLWEAMSIVILEAMACGKPVVATSVGDNKLIINEGETGYLVEPGDVDSMVSAIDLLVEQRELRMRMGNNALEKYNTNFSAKVMARRYENLYMKILADKSL